MKSRKTHIIFSKIALGVLVIGAAVLMLVAFRSKEEKVCKGMQVQIDISQQKGFVEEKEITVIIEKYFNRRPIGAEIKKFNLNTIEAMLEKNVWIKKAQLFFDNNEVLNVQIEQRIPIARVIESSGASYYLDSTGYKLTLSKTDIADVPVFTGDAIINNNKAIFEKIIPLALYIKSDSFWLAQAAQIDVSKSQHFELYPTIGNHMVELGDGLNPADKLGRLKAFYKTIAAKKGFDDYAKLSVVFDRQIIAIKKDSVAPVIDASKAVKVFNRIIKENSKTANEAAEENPQQVTQPVFAGKTKKIEKPSEEKPPDSKTLKNKNLKKEKQTIIHTPKAEMPKVNHHKKN